MMKIYPLLLTVAISFLNSYYAKGRSLHVSFPKKFMSELLSKPSYLSSIAVEKSSNTKKPDEAVALGGREHSIEKRQGFFEEKTYLATCFAWGGSHFKTFDGEIFSFTSACAHTLVQDTADNTFNVVIQNNEKCSKNFENCFTTVTVYIEGNKYVLKHSPEGIPIFITRNEIIPIPGGVSGIRTEKSVHHIIITLDSIGVRIKWDGKQLVQVEVEESLWEKTSGLCGKIDDDPTNDMLTKDGTVPESIVALAQSWQANTPGEECKDIAVDKHTCQGDEGSQAIEFCNKLLSDRRFASCRRDYCSCTHPNPKECVCDTLNVYVRECTHKGITALSKWREEHDCPIRCTGGSVYMPCGPAGGQAVCGGAFETYDGHLACEEGCYCPEGTFLYNSKCIPKENCPCMHEGKEYPPGGSIPRECNTCTCSGGTWVCTQKKCCKRCSAVGDPHFTTFDGKYYDFMGKCAYTLVEYRHFTIEIENIACGTASILPSCVKTVIIKISGQTIELKQGREVTVNGQDVTKMPFYVSRAIIRAPSSSNIIVELPNDIEVWWDGIWTLYVDVPQSFTGQLKGLCGTFNNNQDDDFLTPEGDIEQSAVVFANKWKVTEKCPDILETQDVHPCDANIQNKANAEQYCSIIKSDLFAGCHKDADPESSYKDCLYDMCACNGQLPLCLCPIMGAYARECARQGFHIDWRTEVRECGVQCPSGQKYQVCGNACTRSCYDIATLLNCNQQCVEGCNCPEGETLDELGECIPVRQCDCQLDGVSFPAGHKHIRTVNQVNELCTCINAQWSCKPATQTEISKYFNSSTCAIIENQQFTSCKSTEPATCNNMHFPERVTTAACADGCQCKQEYVLDDTGEDCIKPTACPCYHGGQSYSENSVVRKDCNTCTCKDEKWQCTDVVCLAECSIWGDSHYKTFDSKLYDYQGQCDYVLVKGTTENEHSFSISIQNVPCSSLGVSCLKSIKVRVDTPADHESFTLTRDMKIPQHATLKQLTVKEKGHFVILEAPILKFVVRWDKGTGVYVKLDTLWKNKVKGLCGNYNDNQLDDFLTPDGKIEVSPQLFGDSWRLQPYCPKALDITNTCEKRPDRKAWAIKQCGILKSSVFAKCHSEVAIEIYLENCIFDTCACDQGDDFQCLRTALAAYAQECNKKGIPVKWRTPTLCPMQCDEPCAHYSPCISTCPIETCDNTLIQEPFENMCEQDTCIEGCQVKPCPVNSVYLNSSLLECVPRNICKPTHPFEESGLLTQPVLATKAPLGLL